MNHIAQIRQAEDYPPDDLRLLYRYWICCFIGVAFCCTDTVSVLRNSVCDNCIVNTKCDNVSFFRRKTSLLCKYHSSGSGSLVPWIRSRLHMGRMPKSSGRRSTIAVTKVKARTVLKAYLKNNFISFLNSINPFY